jgi:integrase
MAHLRKHPVSGKPQVRWRDPATGKEHNKTFLRVSDAKAFKTQLEYELSRGIYVDPQGAKTAFSDWIEQWRKSWLHLRETTVLQRDSLLRSHVLPSFGEMALGHITQPHVQAWIGAMRSEGYAPWTIDNTYRLLKGAFDAAVTAGLIHRSPCVGIKKPSVFTNKKEMNFLSPDELSRLAVETGDLGALVLMSGWLGLRWGEVRGLKRKRLNVLKGQVVIEEQIIEPDGRLQLAPLKTEASRRQLSVPGFLNDILREHLARRDCGADDFVFVGSEGAPLRKHWIRRHFKPAVVRAGLSPSLRFHDLRHTCAAFLIHQGAGQYEVQRFLGHASPRTTWENYGHLFEGFEERISQRLNDLYRESNIQLSEAQ